MRALLTTVTLAATFALAQSAAFADAPPGVAVASPSHRDSPFSLQGFGAALILDGVAPMAGLEVGVRLHPAFELELDYAHAAEAATDSIGLLGAGVRWLAVHGSITTYLYAGVAVPLTGTVPIDVPLFRTGMGAEWSVKHGVFVSGQLGINVLAIDGGAFPVPEARLGIGVHF